MLDKKAFTALPSKSWIERDQHDHSCALNFLQKQEYLVQNLITIPLHNVLFAYSPEKLKCWRLGMYLLYTE